MGIRPAPFIKDPCGCEGFTPPLLFFDFLCLLFAKAVVTRMGGDGLRLRELASKTRCAVIYGAFA
jgi:hypothetical protein